MKRSDKTNIYMHNIGTYIHLCIGIYMHLCIGIYTHLCIGIYMHLCIGIYMHLCIRGSNMEKLCPLLYIFLLKEWHALGRLGFNCDILI